MLIRKCLMGALVGMSGGFIVGLVAAFVLGPIGLLFSEDGTGPAADLVGPALLLSIPTGTVIGIVVAIRKHSRLRQAAEEEEHEAGLRR
ncbi:MAG: hypothetical protein C3F08_10405 [Candidatus Methylomirabilota bacterium]|nr:MAG: hypothetical protein C3F08_10405 [candidate division NC10 bacterium]